MSNGKEAYGTAAPAQQGDLRDGDDVVRRKGQANKEKQERESKISLPPPFATCLPGERTKAGKVRSKRGAEVHFVSGQFELLVIHSGEDARGGEKNAGVERWWQARREAEV